MQITLVQSDSSEKSSLSFSNKTSRTKHTKIRYHALREYMVADDLLKDWNEIQIQRMNENLEVYPVSFYIFPYSMISDLDMFCSKIKEWILGSVD